MDRIHKGDSPPCAYSKAILDALQAEIERQIKLYGFALKWDVYHQIEPDTGILRSHFRTLWRDQIGSGVMGYTYRRPNAEERIRMNGSRRWVTVKEGKTLS